MYWVVVFENSFIQLTYCKSHRHKRMLRKGSNYIKYKICPRLPTYHRNVIIWRLKLNTLRRSTCGFAVAALYLRPKYPKSRHSPATVERRDNLLVMKRRSGRVDQNWCVWPSGTQMRTHHLEEGTAEQTDPARTHRAATLTEMNESRQWGVSGNIRTGAAGVPPHSAASERAAGCVPLHVHAKEKQWPLVAGIVNITPRQKWQ